MVAPSARVVNRGVRRGDGEEVGWEEETEEEGEGDDDDDDVREEEGDEGAWMKTEAVLAATFGAVDGADGDTEGRPVGVWCVKTTIVDSRSLGSEHWAPGMAAIPGIPGAAWAG
jgi:hypothetical protein